MFGSKISTGECSSNKHLNVPTFVHALLLSYTHCSSAQPKLYRCFKYTIAAYTLIAIHHLFTYVAAIVLSALAI